MVYFLGQPIRERAKLKTFTLTNKQGGTKG